MGVPRKVACIIRCVIAVYNVLIVIAHILVAYFCCCVLVYLSH